MKSKLELSEEQVLYFRARRSHLVGSGAANLDRAARDILGAQAQQEPPALHALSLRTRSRPTASQVRAQLYSAKRSLVRTWGQRETLHIYSAADWSSTAAARAQWAPAGRRGVIPTRAQIEKAMRRIEAAGEPVTRTEMFPLVTPKLLREAEEKMGPGNPAIRLVAGRYFWCLALRGDVCLADKVGSEQAYAARKHWFPKLDWPDPLPVASVAATELARRYLALHGPATVQDVGHFFGARLQEARVWVDALYAAGLLMEVDCRDRNGLLALKKDRRALCTEPPRGTSDWPLRLLPLWDTLLMAHADKSWAVPHAAECKRIWRKAAFVAQVAVARGRIVAIWTHKKSRRGLEVEVEPLRGWRPRLHKKPLEQEAEALAAHLELDQVRVKVAASA